MNRETRGWLVLALACGAIGALMDSCAAARPAEADSLYAAQQQSCVDIAETREAADQCRARVRAAWALDAGGDR